VQQIWEALDPNIEAFNYIDYIRTAVNARTVPNDETEVTYKESFMRVIKFHLLSWYLLEGM
jgi:hypothetical protein